MENAKNKILNECVRNALETSTRHRPDNASQNNQDAQNIFDTNVHSANRIST